MKEHSGIPIGIYMDNLSVTCMILDVKISEENISRKLVS
jgi:hypothetical protein